jgi:thiamine-monophosphate kinase
LLGGDSVATPGPISLSLTALGTAPQGQAVRRGGARPGDGVFVSGTIGDGALGLLAAKGELAGLAAPAREHLARRYRLPEPRTRLGPRLVGVAHAMLDVSDGLLADLGHLCAASGVAGVVEAARVPLSPAARDVVNADPARLEAVLGGGDDYELLFAAPLSSSAGLAALAAERGVPITQIGRIEPGEGVRVVDEVGRAMAPPRLGYRHF